MLQLLVVDDHPLLRMGLVAAVGAEPDLHVVAQAADADEALRLADAHRPDVTLLDLALPDGSGLDVLRRMRRGCPDARVLVLTVHADRRYVTEAFEAGAAGYVLKQEPAPTILDAIRAVARGRVFLSPMLGSAGPPGEDAEPHGVRRLESLSARERAVFSLAVAGRTNREIGQELGLALKTVQTHRMNINRKLHAHSTADLVRIAARRGLLRD